jgi:hypothetical protein
VRGHPADNRNASATLSKRNEATTDRRPQRLVATTLPRSVENVSKKNPICSALYRNSAQQQLGAVTARGEVPMQVNVFAVNECALQ